jgi:hypothetical protein
VEKRKDKGLARVVLPLHCHRPRLGCPFLRHLDRALHRRRVGSSFLVFWEAWLLVGCFVFLCDSVWNVKKVCVE